MYESLFLLYAGLVRLGHAAYTVQDNYNASNWADSFDFFTFDDPTNGYVNYIDLGTAQSRGLFKTDNDVVTMASDSTSVASKRGRDSLRLTSKNRYTHGLFVVDLAHMPGNACGMWPAFWTVGPDWPESGEIDIIEGVNMQIGNQNTLHTSDGCSFDGKSCLGNMGCGKKFGDLNSYGTGFNANHGGIYAMEWTADHISHWFFARGSEPEDVLGDAPDPSRWGPPKTAFVGGNGCDIDSRFFNHRIVFDMTFCGDWAGHTFALDSECAASGLSCVDYVKNHPQAYLRAHWTVNMLKVYSDDGSGPVVLTSRDTTPASTPALSIISPVVTAINASLPTPFSDNNSSASNPSLLTSLPSLPMSVPSVPTFVPGNNIVVTAAEQQVGTEDSPLVGSGSPTTVTLYISEVVVVDTVPTAPVVYSTAPSANQFRDYSPGDSPYDGPKTRRAHRAARHLENHKSGIYG